MNKEMAFSLTGLSVDVAVEKEDDAARNLGKEEDEEDEYVLLDLEEVFHGAALPPNCTYTLSGLDTMNPILTLGDDLKLGESRDVLIEQCRNRYYVSSSEEDPAKVLSFEHLAPAGFFLESDSVKVDFKIGEYEETFGTVFVFTERDEEVPEEERMHGRKEDGTRRTISSFCKTERKLKFRMMDKEKQGTLGQDGRSQRL